MTVFIRAARLARLVLRLVAALSLVAIVAPIDLAAQTLPNLAGISDETDRYDAAMAIYGDPTLRIPRLHSAVVVDGKLDEAVWQNALAVDVAWQTSPTPNLPARKQTTAYLFDDGTTLYVAFDARDPNPSDIRAHLRKRDELFSDDFVGIGIDTTGDGVKAFEFFANPLGVQGDALSNPRSGDDFAFNAAFSTAGRITATGYEVEFAIPLHQLHFPKKQGDQQWKLWLTRTHWGDQRYSDSHYPRNVDSNCFICDFKPATGLPDVNPSKRLQLIPSVTANASRVKDVEQIRSDTNHHSEEIGIDDFRWGITPNIFLNATINPDFSQIEADIAQSAVNTSFALFFPERRPFFLANRDIFSTEYNLVNTRNIGDPDYGVKLSGKQGQHAFGLMSVHDQVTNFLLPGFEGSTTDQIEEDHQATAMRYRYDLGNSGHLGMIATQREGEDYRNSVGAIDGKYRLGTSNTIRAQVAFSRSRNPQSLINDHGLARHEQDHAIRVRYQFNNNDWFANGVFERVGDEFSADMGFVNIRDLQQTGAVFGRKFQGQDGAKLHHFNLGAQYFDTKRVHNGDLIWRGGGIFTNLGLPRDTWITLNHFQQDRVFQGENFDLKSTNINIKTQPFSGFRYELNSRFGDEIDYVNVRPGDGIWLRQNIEYNLTDHLLMRLRHTYHQLDVDGGRLFTTHLTDARLTYQFDLHNALLLSVIHRNTKRDVSLYQSIQHSRSERLETQLLYSYQLNSQTAFFAGYSSNGIGDDRFDGIRDSLHTVFIKLTHAWRW